MSKREFEKVDEDYFLMMKKVNRRWLDEAKKRMKILVVDTDKLNFANNEETKNKLVIMVIEKLKFD